MSNRSLQLLDLGLVFDGNNFTKDDINVNWVEITCDEDGVWDKKLNKIKKEIERRGK